MAAYIAGELERWPSKAQPRMGAILRAGGLSVTVGHYALRVEDCERFQIECYGGDLGDPQIEADAATLDRLLADARRVLRRPRRSRPPPPLRVLC